MMQPATFVTVWNNGLTKIKTSCDYDSEVGDGLVCNIEVSDTEVQGTLDETYIELADGRIISDFTDDNGLTYEDGQIVDDGIVYLDEEDVGLQKDRKNGLYGPEYKGEKF